ncbi:hypothetical protein [Flexistipes sinusarabici]|uniref:hypothetical protein n=1 Tax=Flexistipes sinusarabici TaxID=2352 RepID=UPI0011D2B1C4|nr:hypothetical protein [Flexistipes sinusarabici]
MNSAAIHTPVTFQVYSLCIKQIAKHISMAPQTITFATGTHSRTGERVIFAQGEKLLDYNGKINYHLNTLWLLVGVMGVVAPARLLLFSHNSL